MNGVVGSIGDAGRRDLFYLDEGFRMKQRYWNGSEWVIDWVELGGIFTSVPAVVSTMAHRPMVIGTHAGHLAEHELTPADETTSSGTTLGSATAHELTPDVELRATDESVLEPESGPVPTTPVGTGHGDALGGVGEVLTQRIDVFGLGLDYAMYQKTLWGQAVSQPGPWHNLGGVFTSAPAAIWLDGQLHVFGLGTDLSMWWRTWNGSKWSDGWTRIGGYFSSTPVVVSWGPGRMDVFARHADFSLRRRTFEDGGWAGDWQNLGGSLASAPAVVTWGPDRIDVFAVGNLPGAAPDGGLIHRWWDGDIWNDWEQIAGKSTGDDVAFTCAPAAATWGPGRLDVFSVDTEGTLRHVWYADGSWSNPASISEYMKMRETPMALVTGPNQLELVAGGRDHNMWRKILTGSSWEPLNWWQMGDKMRLPSQYRISIDLIRCNTPRSLNNDTVTGQCTLKIGNWPNAVGVDTWPLHPLTQRQGDLGNTAIDEGQTNLMHYDPVTIELHETAAFNYTFVNSNKPGNEVEQALEAQALDLADKAVKSAVDAAASGIGLSAVQVGALAAPLTGSLLTLLTGYLIDQLHTIVEDQCDGTVAIEQYVRRGDDLQKMVIGGQPVQMAVKHEGTTSPTHCGANSEYTVSWSIRRATA